MLISNFIKTYFIFERTTDENGKRYAKLYEYQEINMFKQLLEIEKVYKDRDKDRSLLVKRFQEINMYLCDKKKLNHKQFKELIKIIEEGK